MRELETIEMPRLPVSLVLNRIEVGVLAVAV